MDDQHQAGGETRVVVVGLQKNAVCRALLADYDFNEDDLRHLPERCTLLNGRCRCHRPPHRLQVLDTPQAMMLTRQQLYSRELQKGRQLLNRRSPDCVVVCLMFRGGNLEIMGDVLGAMSKVFGEKFTDKALMLLTCVPPNTPPRSLYHLDQKLRKLALRCRERWVVWNTSQPEESQLRLRTVVAEVLGCQGNAGTLENGGATVGEGSVSDARNAETESGSSSPSGQNGVSLYPRLPVEHELESFAPPDSAAANSPSCRGDISSLDRFGKDDSEVNRCHLKHADDSLTTVDEKESEEANKGKDTKTVESTTPPIPQCRSSQDQEELIPGRVPSQDADAQCQGASKSGTTELSESCAGQADSSGKAVHPPAQPSRSRRLKRDGGWRPPPGTGSLGGTVLGHAPPEAPGSSETSEGAGRVGDVEKCLEKTPASQDQDGGEGKAKGDDSPVSGTDRDTPVTEESKVDQQAGTSELDERDGEGNGDSTETLPLQHAIEAVCREKQLSKVTNAEDLSWQSLSLVQLPSINVFLTVNTQEAQFNSSSMGEVHVKSKITQIGQKNTVLKK